MADELSQVHLTGRQIRVLAHPLRVRLLGRLRGEGPATATGLAGVLGTNTGATSYHLRQLAEAGLVVEEERSGAGRQRWWRAAHDMSSWRRSYYLDDPDATAAAEWLEAFQVNRFVELAEQWRRGLPDEPAEWRDTGELSDYLLHMDPDQVRALMGDIEQLVETHVAAAKAAPRPGARHVALYLAALPKHPDDAHLPPRPQDDAMRPDDDVPRPEDDAARPEGGPAPAEED
ncbi:helix-turn-helix transcriptional regulator [Actinoplanes sp. NEAU-A11]|uniref:Helix-turn-helix transcriptional regulator n=1 Tax=Actinoplanes aureus TaxID=2792083 RepID=A0A931CDX0_9ACTN|nr:helix-turn-helix transcriptional regulator [Actinoplanes aureus]